MTAAPPACVRLSAELRTLRERAGLTLGELADRTPYSRSAWHRYLNARALPPWPAVRSLADLAGEPEPRLRAMWQLADTAWSGRTRTAPAPAADPAPPARPAPPAAVRPGPVAASEPEPPPAVTPPALPAAARAGRGRLRAVVTILATAAACGGLAVLVAADPWSRPAGHPSSAVFHVGCTGVACNGHDPQTALCGVEPDTVLHRQVPAGIGLEIRYSPTCRAAWARVWNVTTGDRLTFSVPGQPVQSVTDTSSGDLDPFVYTPLAAVTGHHVTLRACVTVSAGRAPVCYTAASP